MQAQATLLLAVLSAGAISIGQSASPRQAQAAPGGSSSSGGSDVSSIGATRADSPGDRVDVSGGAIGASEVGSTGGPTIDAQSKVDVRQFGLGDSCPQRIDAEPLLDYDVSGGTLAGIYTMHLSVFSNGTVSVSELDPIDGQPYVGIQFLDPTETDALQDDLLAAGADQLCDDTIYVLDAPLATMTIHEKDGSTHSFNYFPVVDYGDWKDAEDLVQGFLSSTFPEHFGN